MKRVYTTLIITALTVSSLCASDVAVRFYSKYEIKNAVIYSGTEKNIKCRLRLNGNLIEADYNGRKKVKTDFLELFNGAYGEYSVETSGQKRKIPGRIRAYLMPGEKGIVLVATMDIEDYVPCVLAAEMDAAIYRPELAKAFAVVIRTFAKNKRHEKYDLCDLTHCEVFKGRVEGGGRKAEGMVKDQRSKFNANTVETLLAASRNMGKTGDIWYDPVIATRGMVLAGACVDNAVYFSACCGGVTENAGEFAKGRAGKCGLSKPDVFNGRNLCREHRYFNWTKHLNKGDVENALASFTEDKTPDIMDIKVTARTAAGRVKEMDFAYMSGGLEKHIVLDVNKYLSVFGKQAGWAPVPSKWFEIKKQGSGFVLNGRGHGHGVGLCLQGASTLAKEGKNFREILKFYFPELYIR